MLCSCVVEVKETIQKRAFSIVDPVAMWWGLSQQTPPEFTSLFRLLYIFRLSRFAGPGAPRRRRSDPLGILSLGDLVYT